MADFGHLLGNNGPKVSKALDTIAELQAPVGSGAYELGAFELSGGQGLVLLDQPVRIAAGAKLAVRFGASGDVARSVFEEGDAWAPPADRRLAELELQGTFGVSAPGTGAPMGPGSLSFKLNASAELRYRHRMSVAGAISRFSALESLVVGSRLPHTVSFGGIRDGEVHEFSALFSLALGAEGALGKDLALKTDLFQGLAPEIGIHFQYAIKASLNASLYERLNWIVGAGEDFASHAGWVRIRATRESRRRLTLGVQFALDVEYALGGTLEALLNRALELNPVDRAMNALRDIRRHEALLAGGDWGAVKDRIEHAAADRIADFLEPVLTNAEAVKRIVAVSAQVVDAYDRLGDTLQSFWDGLLNRGSLDEQRGKLRERLERIKNLPDDPAALLSQDEQDLIALVEAISGASLEDIWLGSGAGSVIGKVKRDAARALSFLDEVERLPDTALARLSEFAGRTGIQGTIAWIRSNASSLEGLKAAANDRIRRLVEKLVNKAFDRIDAADLEKIRTWAERLDGILAAPGEIEKELRTKLERLNGTVGFKLALEIDRVSRSTALLDLEFDPHDKGMVHAMEGLSGSTLTTVLRKLPGRDGDSASTTGELPFLIRECAFTSQRLRTSTRSFFFSLFGTSGNTRQRLTEFAVDAHQEGAAIVRKAVYTGCFTHSVENAVTKSGHTWSTRFAASAGWTASAEGPGADLAGPYAAPGHRLRLTITRDDDATTADELAAVGVLLADLGFVVDPAPDPRSADHATRLAISIELGAGAARGFLGDGTYDGAWDVDVLNAARRWFDERLTHQLATELDPDLSRGAVLAALMEEASFRSGWTKLPSKFEEDYADHPFTVHLAGGLTVDVTLVRKIGAITPWGNYNMVRDLIARRHDAQRPMRAAAQSFGAGPKDHAGLTRLAQAFAAVGNAVSPGFWDNPAFAVWLVLARLARTAPESLSTATGLASLRFKDDATDTWSDPQRWTLDPARLPGRTPGHGIFPIV